MFWWRPLFWLLLSSLFISNLGGGRDLGKGHNQVTWPSQTRGDVPQHMMSAQIQKLRKRRSKCSIQYLQYLPSKPTATYSEAELPSKWMSITCWWKIEKNFFFLSLHTCGLCFCLVKSLYLYSQEFFSILSSPTSHPMSCWRGERYSGLLSIWCPAKVNIHSRYFIYLSSWKRKIWGILLNFSGFSCSRSLVLLWWRQKNKLGRLAAGVLQKIG